MITEIIRTLLQNSRILQASRANILKRMYLAVLFGIAFITAISSLSSFIRGSITSAGLFRYSIAAVLVILLWVLYRQDSWPYTIRSTLLLSLIYLGVMTGVTRNGLSGDVRIVLLLIVVLAFLLTGLRGGAVALIVSWITIILIGVLQANGSLSDIITEDRIEELLLGTTSISITSLYAFVLITIVYAIYQINSDVQRSFFEQNALLKELQSEAKMQEDRIRLRSEALTISTNIGYRISDVLDELSLLRLTLQEAQHNKAYDKLQIYLWSDANECLERQALLLEDGRRTGREKEAHAIPVEHTKNRLMYCYKKEQNLLMNFQMIGWDQETQTHLFHQTQCEIATPIFSQDRVIGVFNVQQNSQSGLSTDDLYLLETVASQLGVALQNARRYSREQRKIEQEALLNYVTQAIQNATTIEEVLQTAATQIGELTTAGRVNIQLGTEKERLVS